MCVYVCMCMSFACAGAGAVQRRTSNVFFGPFLLNVINLWAHSDLSRLDRKSWGSICPNPHIHTHFCSEVISKNKHTLFSFLVVVFVLFVCFFFLLSSEDPNSGYYICIEIIRPTNHFLIPYFFVMWLSDSSHTHLLKTSFLFLWTWLLHEMSAGNMCIYVFLVSLLWFIFLFLSRYCLYYLWFFIIFINSECKYVCVCIHYWHGMYVELRGQCGKVSFSLPPCVSQRWNSCCQCCQQASLSALPSWRAISFKIV